MKSQNIINLTPHPIRVLDENGEVKVEIEPTGDVPRIEEKEYNNTSPFIYENNSIPSSEIHLEEIEGLPEPQKNTWFIVPKVIAMKSDRDDLVVPSDFVRDEQGRIQGCRKLSQIY